MIKELQGQINSYIEKEKVIETAIEKELTELYS